MSPPTEADLSYLKGLGDVPEWLGLKGFSTWKALHLNGTRIDDAGLIHLRGLRSLQNLRLSDTPIGDAGLAHLADLTMF